ncbi:hypothetical protein SAMN06269185_1801 [Natronoarchaeum philippinense]|uniref:Uncharacterized protein n=1 Tax=Natronoarchaeum philippinense TaxID=558529 RepID=A0A285NSX0_NATPI|nr:hypothetical protein [Natronoarchaeum philippinense]SNZ12549.1 hypothetical protein SAMN06269185_1801 [Natronoarchaeum philippinense]
MSGDDGRFVGRREVLAALGAAALAPTADEVLGLSGASAPSPEHAPMTTGEADATLRVRTYPRLASAADRWSGWSLATLAAHGAVGDALDAVATYAQSERDGLSAVDWKLEAGAGVSLPPGLDAPTLIERFAETVRERDPDAEHACHLLLWSEPLNFRIGYGYTRSDVAAAAEGAYTIANVGATERWDGRAVTKNMAIHETLHAFLTGEDAEAVIGHSCEHNLGAVRHVGDGIAEVTPMATAYAGRSTPMDETTWSGRGCRDPDAFYRHDGVDGVDEWRHTTELSEGTLDAAARYVEHQLTGD